MGKHLNVFLWHFLVQDCMTNFDPRNSEAHGVLSHVQGGCRRIMKRGGMQKRILAASSMWDQYQKYSKIPKHVEFNLFWFHVSRCQIFAMRQSWSWTARLSSIFGTKAPMLLLFVSFFLPRLATILKANPKKKSEKAPKAKSQPKGRTSDWWGAQWITVVFGCNWI